MILSDCYPNGTFRCKCGSGLFQSLVGVTKPSTGRALQFPPPKHPCVRCAVCHTFYSFLLVKGEKGEFTYEERDLGQ